jgi:hypothetical protein
MALPLGSNNSNQGLTIRDSDGDVVHLQTNDFSPTTVNGTWYQNLLHVDVSVSSGSVEIVSSGREVVVVATDTTFVYTVGDSGAVTYPSGMPVLENTYTVIPSTNFSGFINYAAVTGESGNIWIYENE